MLPRHDVRGVRLLEPCGGRLDRAHPRDKKTREKLRRVVETLERALATHD
jgi:hypothetical protein